MNYIRHLTKLLLYCLAFLTLPSLHAQKPKYGKTPEDSIRNTAFRDDMFQKSTVILEAIMTSKPVRGKNPMPKGEYTHTNEYGDWYGNIDTKQFENLHSFRGDVAVGEKIEIHYKTWGSRCDCDETNPDLPRFGKPSDLDGVSLLGAIQTRPQVLFCIPSDKLPVYEGTSQVFELYSEIPTSVLACFSDRELVSFPGTTGWGGKPGFSYPTKKIFYDDLARFEDIVLPKHFRYYKQDPVPYPDTTYLKSKNTMGVNKTNAKLYLKISNAQLTQNDQFYEFDITAKGDVGVTSFLEALRVNIEYDTTAFVPNIAYYQGTQLWVTKGGSFSGNTSTNQASYTTSAVMQWNPPSQDIVYFELSSPNYGSINYNRAAINATEQVVLHVKMKLKTDACLQAVGVNFALTASSSQPSYVTSPSAPKKNYNAKYQMEKQSTK